MTCGEAGIARAGSLLGFAAKSMQMKDILVWGVFERVREVVDQAQPSAEQAHGFIQSSWLGDDVHILDHTSGK